jgi:hypothetical protein
VNDEVQALDLESRVEEYKWLHLHNHILFFYIIILRLLTITCTLCCNGEVPCD